MWIFGNRPTKCITETLPATALKVNEKVEFKDMTQIAREELIRRVKAMDEQELEIVADNLPIELCLQRIRKEIDRSRQLEDFIKNATAMIN